VAPKSGTTEQFYCTVYYITLKSNCEAQRVSKKLERIVKFRVRGQNNVSVNIQIFKGKKLCLRVTESCGKIQ
jgi:hypothetical protein